MHQHDVERWSAVYFVSEGEPNAPGSPWDPTPPSPPNGTPHHTWQVSEGEPNAPGFPNPDGGHMLFRCGPKPRSAPTLEPPPRRGGGGGRDDTTAAAAAAACGGAAACCSHSYMSVAPLPGTMWIFPGSVPHAVMHTVLPPGVSEPEQLRISVGINFLDARSPPPHTALG